MRRAMEEISVETHCEELMVKYQSCSYSYYMNAFIKCERL
jgi:hypothetical protein